MSNLLIRIYSDIRSCNFLIRIYSDIHLCPFHECHTLTSWREPSLRIIHTYIEYEMTNLLLRRGVDKKHARLPGVAIFRIRFFKVGKKFTHVSLPVFGPAQQSVWKFTNMKMCGKKQIVTFYYCFQKFYIFTIIEAKGQRRRTLHKTPYLDLALLLEEPDPFERKDLFDFTEEIDLHQARQQKWKMWKI